MGAAGALHAMLHLSVILGCVVCGALGSLELSAIGANASSGLLLGTAAFGLLVGGVGLWQGCCCCKREQLSAEERQSMEASMWSANEGSDPFDTSSNMPTAKGGSAAQARGLRGGLAGTGAGRGHANPMPGYGEAALSSCTYEDSEERLLLLRSPSDAAGHAGAGAGAGSRGQAYGAPAHTMANASSSVAAAGRAGAGHADVQMRASTYGPPPAMHGTASIHSMQGAGGAAGSSYARTTSMAGGMARASSIRGAAL